MARETDKIIIDTSDSEELDNFFSRLEPGDKASGRWVATLNEYADKTAVLSLTKVEVDSAAKDETEDPELEEGQSVAAAVMGMNEE